MNKNNNIIYGNFGGSNNSPKETGAGGLIRSTGEGAPEAMDKSHLTGRLMNLLGRDGVKLYDARPTFILIPEFVEELCAEEVGTSDDRTLGPDMIMGASLRRISLEQARKEQL